VTGRWTTTWRFDAGGSCRQTIVAESLAEGFPRTTERSCIGFSPDRLVLDGYEYQRLS
jgi:hypothetical protein